jgi:DNA polymerase III epsilon subunit-like protein
MKIFFDTEFTGLYKNNSLISIGLVAENGEKFYAEFNDYNTLLCSPWVRDNIIDKLTTTSLDNGEEPKFIQDYHIGDRYSIGNALIVWLSQFDYVELVSDCCHYDMVLFCDLFGGGMTIPKNVAPVCYDINQDIAKYFNISQQEAFEMSREDILKQLRFKVTRTKPYSLSVDWGSGSEDNKHNSLYDACVTKDIYTLMDMLNTTEIGED